MDRRALLWATLFTLTLILCVVAVPKAALAADPPTHVPNIASEALPIDLPSTVVDLESHPLPRAADSSRAGLASGSSTTPAWWNGPEARVVGSLLLLLVGAIVFAKYGPKSLRGAALAGGTRPSGVVQVLARFPVGRGRQLLLLECGPRILLLEETKSRGGGGLQTLSEFTTPEEVADLRTRIEAANRPSDASFRQDLERSLETYSRTGAPVSFGQGAIPGADSIETVDLTRRRPRRSARGRE